MTHPTLRTLVRATAAATLLVAGATAALAGSATPATAQPPQGGGGGRGGQMMQNMLFEGITLTDAQKTKIDSIRGDFRAKMMAERGNAGAGGPPDSAAMAARRERMQAERTALRAVLTADQQATFDKNVQGLEERMRTMRQRGAGAPPR
jgi:Spy/CpxP family protein refolding chaperone